MSVRIEQQGPVTTVVIARPQVRNAVYAGHRAVPFERELEL